MTRFTTRFVGETRSYRQEMGGSVRVGELLVEFLQGDPDGYLSGDCFWQEAP